MAKAEVELCAPVSCYQRVGDAHASHAAFKYKHYITQSAAEQGMVLHCTQVDTEAQTLENLCITVHNIQLTDSAGL